MNPERKAMWLQDLRSGEFQQGRGTLHSVDGEGNEEFCCLGLVSKRAFEAGICTRKLDAHAERYIYEELDGSCSSETGLLPSIMKWLGFEPREDGGYDQSIKVFIGMGLVRDYSVIYLNDDLRWTFPQIADVVERTF